MIRVPSQNGLSAIFFYNVKVLRAPSYRTIKIMALEWFLAHYILHYFFGKVIIKSITKFVIFYILAASTANVSQFDKNGYNPICDETLLLRIMLRSAMSLKIWNRISGFDQFVYVPHYKRGSSVVG